MSEKENLIQKAIIRQPFIFEEFLSYLQNYKDEFKNVNISTSYVCPNGYTLGGKIRRIRSGRIKLTEQQKAKLQEVGLVCDSRSFIKFDFDEFYNRLLEYKKVNKDVDISISYICQDGYNLGQKIKNIRIGIISLTNQQKAKLEELGFAYDGRPYIKFDFDDFYNRLLEYIKVNNNGYAASSYICKDGYNLGYKFKRIRQGVIKLTNQQKAKLVELGFIWDVQPIVRFNFDEFYNYLQEYKKVNKNIDVRQAYVCPDGYKLGQKIMTIREGGIRLTEQQKSMLNEMDFVWNAKIFDFNEFRKHLIEYRKTYSDARIPIRYVCPDGYILGVKMKNIRLGRTKLTNEQKEVLNKIEFNWDSKREGGTFKFDVFYRHLEEYKEEYKDVNVKQTYVCPDGYKLGQKVRTIRDCGIILSDEQRAKLNKIGFNWNVKVSAKLAKFDFEIFYKKLVEYKQQFNSCFVEYDYVVDNYELGFFVRNIRNRRLQLTDAQMEKLNELDFVFNTQDYYKDKPNEPMIKRMLNGDLTARNDYLQKYMPLVHKIAFSYKNSSNVSDLIGQGYDALNTALDNTTTNIETKLKAYVGKTINYEIKHFIIKANQITSLQEEVQGFDDITVEETIPDDRYRPDELVEDSAFNEQLLKRAKQILTRDEYKLICLHFGFSKSGTAYSANQLAEKFNTTPQKVEKVLQKILEKLKQHLQKDEWMI